MKQVIFQARRATRVVFFAVAFLTLTQKFADANPFRPKYCGQCTDGAWILWTNDLRQSETPSIRSAKYWYDDAPNKGFSRGNVARTYSLMVFDGWEKNASGHVGVSWQVTERWSGDFDLVLLLHVNWSPATAGNCNAPFQANWVAYHRPTKSAYVWNGSRWSQALAVKGFVYRK